MGSTGAIGDEWLAGWDATPGIVSVWAAPDGRVMLWRRVEGSLVREDLRFRPWVLTAHEDAVRGHDRITYRELSNDGALQRLARAEDLPTLTRALLQRAARRLGHELGHVRELGDDAIVLAPDEQYLVASGRTYFHGLAFADLRRMQVDLETTGLDPDRDRIFLIAVRDPEGRVELLEGAEPELIARLVERVRASDPDVLENHALHGFAMAFGISTDDRELIRGDRIHAVYATDPERVRRYASADVEEVAHLSRMLGD